MSEEPRTGPSGSGSGPAYTVEARTPLNFPPVEVCGVVVDCSWRPVSFDRRTDGIGVPPGLLLNSIARDNGYVSYEAAMALAWWFVASAERVGIEVRVVEHEFSYSYKSERRAESETMTHFNRRIEQRTAESMTTRGRGE